MYTYTKAIFRIQLLVGGEMLFNNIVDVLVLIIIMKGQIVHGVGIDRQKEREELIE